MSQENAQKFLATVQQDPALQDQIRNLDAADKGEAITQLAAGLGYDFTLEELQSALADRSSDALDDATLEQVVGGGAFDDFTSWLGDAIKHSGLGRRIARGGVHPNY